MVYDYNINDLTACRTYRVIRCGSEVVLILKRKEGGVISAGSPTATHDDISLAFNAGARRREENYAWMLLSMVFPQPFLLFLHLFFPV